MLRIVTVFTLLISICTSRISFSDVITKIEFQQNLVISDIYIRLFEDIAPLTVTNFRSYSNNTTQNGGNYNHSFIHRSVPGFVIQGGGFLFDPVNGAFINDPLVNDFSGGLHDISADAQIQNEFSLSNLEGTISMAKISGNPDSASSQWFINLVDNSTILDQENGGYTVFGKVIGNGMTVVNDIASKTIFSLTNIHAAFGELPLLNYTSGSVQQENLIRVNKLTEILSITSDVNFNFVALGNTAQANITLKNIDTSNIQIGNIADTDSLLGSFSIASNNCTLTTLLPSDVCTISVEFTPLLTNTYSDSFNIEFTNPSLSYTVSVSGSGALVVEPNIIVSTIDYDFGDVAFYDPANGNTGETISIGVINNGNANLNVTSVTMAGVDTSYFELVDECVNASPLLRQIDQCIIKLTFKPLSDGIKSIDIRIESDDPDRSILLIPVSGSSSLDGDGVLSSIEDISPNNGDGNNDDILDSIQSNVASVNNGSDYITYIVNQDLKLKEVEVLDMSQFVNPPSDIAFDQGVTQYTVDISSLPPGTGIEVGLVLPAAQVLKTYYMYGPTPDNTNPHWYVFTLDNTTGTGVTSTIANVNIESASGDSIRRSIAKLFVKDGARGDSDLTADGKITIQGVAVTQPISSDGGNGGMINAPYFLFTVLLIIYGRSKYQRHDLCRLS